jgi:hypothetical protein
LSLSSRTQGGPGTRDRLAQGQQIPTPVDGSGLGRESWELQLKRDWPSDSEAPRTPWRFICLWRANTHVRDSLEDTISDYSAFACRNLLNTRNL